MPSGETVTASQPGMKVRVTAASCQTSQHPALGTVSQPVGLELQNLQHQDVKMNREINRIKMMKESPDLFEDSPATSSKPKSNCERHNGSRTRTRHLTKQVKSVSLGIDSLVILAYRNC